MTFESRSRGFSEPFIGQLLYGWYRIPNASASLRRSTAPSGRAGSEVGQKSAGPTADSLLLTPWPRTLHPR